MDQHSFFLRLHNNDTILQVVLLDQVYLSWYVCYGKGGVALQGKELEDIGVCIKFLRLQLKFIKFKQRDYLMLISIAFYDFFFCFPVFSSVSPKFRLGSSMKQLRHCLANSPSTLKSSSNFQLFSQCLEMC